MDCPFDNYSAFDWHEREMNRRKQLQEKRHVFSDDAECEDYEDDEDDEYG